MRIGIPRALLFYQYYPLWKTFFEYLGHEVVVSSPTNQKILSDGIEYTVDDACLPVKIFHGHVMDLIGKVDCIYIPRIISIKSREFICPKFLGLPDMVKYNIPSLPVILDYELNLYDNPHAQRAHFFRLGKTLKGSICEVIRAYFTSLKVQRKIVDMVKREKVTPPEAFVSLEGKGGWNTKTKKKDYTILVLGHPYNVFDDHFSMGLIKKLKCKGIGVLTCEMIDEKKIEIGARQLPKKMFWTLGKKVLGTAYFFLQGGKIDGIISVASFGCGPDSLVGELLEIRVHRDFDIPFLYLNLDEQSGEAGFDTRIEAFLDIVEGRKGHEGNLSTNGQLVYTPKGVTRTNGC